MKDLFLSKQLVSVRGQVSAGVQSPSVISRVHSREVPAQGWHPGRHHGIFSTGMALTSGALLDDRDTLRGDARVVGRDEQVGMATLAAVEVREPVRGRERTPARLCQMLYLLASLAGPSGN